MPHLFAHFLGGVTHCQDGDGGAAHAELRNCSSGTCGDIMGATSIFITSLYAAESFDPGVPFVPFHIANKSNVSRFLSSIKMALNATWGKGQCIFYNMGEVTL